MDTQSNSLDYLSKTRVYSQTLICKTVYTDPGIIRPILVHVLIIAIIAAMLYSIVRFSQKVYFFPIKERAPLLTILQLISFTLSLGAIYLTDILTGTMVEWNVNKAADIPASRSYMKAFYTSLRLGNYFIYIMRTLVIYSNWKEVKAMKSLTDFFRNEKTCLIVSFRWLSFLMFF